MRVPLFYKSKPIFGLDIGQGTVKVVQLKHGKRHSARLVGYGYADFDHKAIKGGEIVDNKPIVKALEPLIKNIVIGKLTTDRAAVSIPSAHTFTRILNLPTMDSEDLQQAVELEAEQYVPVPVNQLYIEYEMLGTEKKKDGKSEINVLMVATPRKVVDSFVNLFNELNLEIYTLEPTLFSILRAVNHSTQKTAPKIVIDFGALSSDLTIYDQTVRLTSTTNTGGEHITDTIAQALSIKREKAAEIKTRYGIGPSKWQVQLAPALQPILTGLATEVQKLMRYYNERSDNNETLSDIIIVGGGANLPGLADFLSHLTGLTTTICNPWDNITVKPLQPPHQLETTLYTTAIGLALKELERDD